MANRIPGLSAQQMREMAKAIAEAIIRDKREEEIARMEQDEIDARLFPIMQQLEDKVDEHLTKIIEEVFEKSVAVGGVRNWWDE